MLAFPCCFPPPTPTHSSLHQLLEKLPEGLFFFLLCWSWGSSRKKSFRCCQTHNSSSVRLLLSV